MKWQIGDVTVTKIVELETTGGSRFILAQATREAIVPISWLIPDFADPEGRLKMSIHAFIVEAPGRRIVVDTCLGNDKKDRRIPTWNDRQGRFPEDLAAAGSARETSIRSCARSARRSRRLEHHAGRWPVVPTFPNARYLFGRVEYEHWSTRRSVPTFCPCSPTAYGRSSSFGLADLVEWDHRICPRSASCRARATRRVMPAS